MSEFLINYNGKWYIAHAGVAMWPDDIGNKVFQLVWCDRDGSVICINSETNEVKELPQ